MIPILTQLMNYFNGKFGRSQESLRFTLTYKDHQNLSQSQTETGRKLTINMRGPVIVLILVLMGISIIMK